MQLPVRQNPKFSPNDAAKQYRTWRIGSSNVSKNDGGNRYHGVPAANGRAKKHLGIMDHSAISALLDSTFAPWIRDLGLSPESILDASVTLRLPHADKLRHAGGVICGQVFMAAADTAMIVAISHAHGGFQPMTTVSLTTSFLRPVKSGDVLVTATILRRGRNLVFGAIELHDETGALAAHATTTVMLIA